MAATISKEVTLKTLLAIKDLGKGKDLFRSKDVRERLGYSVDRTDPYTKYMHNVITRLKTQGVLQPAGEQSRQRNKYLFIKDESGLRRAIDRAKNRQRPAAPVARTAATVGPAGEIGAAAAADRGTGPRRVLYLEERVDQLASQVESLLGALDDLPERLTRIEKRLEALDRMESEVHRLHSEWIETVEVA